MESKGEIDKIFQLQVVMSIDQNETNKTTQNVVTTSSQTTLVDVIVTSPDAKEIVEQVSLRGADSPNIYKNLLVSQSSLDVLMEKLAEPVIVPVLRGPDSPNTYARYT